MANFVAASQIAPLPDGSYTLLEETQILIDLEVDGEIDKGYDYLTEVWDGDTLISRRYRQIRNTFFIDGKYGTDIYLVLDMVKTKGELLVKVKGAPGYGIDEDFQFTITLDQYKWNGLVLTGAMTTMFEKVSDQGEYSVEIDTPSDYIKKYIEAVSFDVYDDEELHVSAPATFGTTKFTVSKRIGPVTSVVVLKHTETGKLFTDMGPYVAYLEPNFVRDDTHYPLTAVSIKDSSQKELSYIPRTTNLYANINLPTYAHGSNYLNVTTESNSAGSAALHHKTNDNYIGGVEWQYDNNTGFQQAKGRFNFATDAEMFEPTDRVVLVDSYSETVIKEYPVEDVEYSFIGLSKVKMKSLPPIDLMKPYWKAVIDTDYDFVPPGAGCIPCVGEVWSPNTNFIELVGSDGGVMTGSINHVVVRNILSNETKYSYPFECYIFVNDNYMSLFYPDEHILLKIGDQNAMTYMQLAPLIKTDLEKADIISSGQIVNGGNAQLTANTSGFSHVNAGIMRYKWFKDGVEIPGQMSRVLRLNNLSSTNTGDYTVESSMYPAGYIAPDSHITATSEKFNINLGAPVTVDLTIVAPDTITIGEEFTITGTVTASDPSTINSVVLEKDNAIVHTFDKAETALTYTKTAAANDDGNYQFVVIYNDGVERTAVSESKPVAFTDDIVLELTASVVTPAPIAEGETLTLTADVVANQINRAELEGLIAYQWYFRGRILTGASNKVLSIPGATFLDNAGEYYFKAAVNAVGYKPVQVDSNKVQVVIKHNIHLVPLIKADSTIVAHGKPAHLFVEFSSDVPVDKEWDWFHNGSLISGSRNKTEITHVGAATSVYTVKAHATQETDGTPVLGLEVQSNPITVRTVFPVELLNPRITGTGKVTSEMMGSRLELKADLSSTVVPPGYVQPNVWEYTFEWYNDKGVKVSTSDSYIATVTPETLGTYHYIIRSRVDTTITKRSSNHLVYLDDTPGGDGDCIKYVHDLNPGRDRGFVWMGYWVIDEIYIAQMEGFDWVADPENSRFTYPCDMKTLAKALTDYPDIEVQESRHGYILTKKDLVN